MGGGDKLELTIAGRPILRRTIESMAASPAIDRVIVVTAPERVAGLREAPWLRALEATGLLLGYDYEE